MFQPKADHGSLYGFFFTACSGDSNAASVTIWDLICRLTGCHFFIPLTSQTKRSSKYTHKTTSLQSPTTLAQVFLWSYNKIVSIRRYICCSKSTSIHMCLFIYWKVERSPFDIVIFWILVPWRLRWQEGQLFFLQANYKFAVSGVCQMFNFF